MSLACAITAAISATFCSGAASVSTATLAESVLSGARAAADSQEASGFVQLQVKKEMAEMLADLQAEQKHQAALFDEHKLLLAEQNAALNKQLDALQSRVEELESAKSSEDKPLENTNTLTPESSKAMMQQSQTQSTLATSQLEESFANKLAMFEKKMMDELKASHKKYSPQKIVLLRHGQSEGNVNAGAYGQTGDCQIGLTPLGKQQAEEAGRRLKKIVGDSPLYVPNIYKILWEVK